MPTESRVVEFFVIMFLEGHLVQDCGPGSGLYLPSQETVKVYMCFRANYQRSTGHARRFGLLLTLQNPRHSAHTLMPLQPRNRVHTRTFGPRYPVDRKDTE